METRGNLVLIKIPNKNDYPYSYNGIVNLDSFFVGGREYMIEIDNGYSDFIIFVGDIDTDYKLNGNDINLIDYAILMNNDKLNEFFESKRETNLKKLGI